MWSFRSPNTSGEATHAHTTPSRQPLEIRVRDLDAERPPVASVSAPLSMGGLLRLFRSDFFDAFMAVTYLYRYRESRGVHDYLCNELYKIQDADLETFMPQICNLLVHHAQNSPGLERFIMDRCAHSMHVALQVFWFLQAAVEDAARHQNKQREARCRLLRTRCETAAVNGSKHVMLEAAATRISHALVANESPFSAKKQINGNSLFPSSSASQLGLNSPSRSTMKLLLDGRSITSPNTLSSINEDEELAQSEAQPSPPPQSAHEHVIATAVHMEAISITDHPPQQQQQSSEHQSTPSSSSSYSSSDSDIVTHTDTQAIVSNQPPLDDSPSNTEQAADVVRMKDVATASSKPEQEQLSPKPQQKPQKLIPQNLAETDMDYDPVTLLTMKQERFDYFNDSVSIAKAFVALSLSTRELPQDQRQAHLARGLEKINDILLRRMKGEPGIPLLDDASVPNAEEIANLGVESALRSIHLPLTRASSRALRILRIHSEEVVILTSRTRAPYLVNIEVLPTEMLCSDKLLFCEQRVSAMRDLKERNDVKPPVFPSPSKHGVKASSCEEEQPKRDSVSPQQSKPLVSSRTSATVPRTRRLSEMTPVERQRANVRKAIYGDPYSQQPDLFAKVEVRCDDFEDEDDPEHKSRQAVILGVYGELWSWKEDRILARSPFNKWKGTKLMPFIVKAGDDLRQEQLAVQLISQFKKIFDEEQVDLYLRPFTVMSVSSEAGFVEVLTDSVSVHSLKKRTPNFVSLLDYFERAYGKIGTRTFRAAQRRFIRSMAGYSLVTYLLQIKDRHNGNIMIDAHGRIIHIDFGFMLTNSPGAIKFENVPFKLTEEYLQVICAKKNVQDLAEASKTEGYRYFQELFVLGLLAVRKHQDKITTLVEIMTDGTTMPCMTGGHSILEALRSRFAVGMPEEQCISFGLGLIEESRLSWRSAGYDRFQAYSNGYR
ncbi:Phosphatidylinositol 4-kinase [Gracilariopsis chorda]|uniref:1-phosphatidylinositol 4-kinase n=1 Tax=Gracilariopsis chorda TaxID=448386 RepID=A0A2V3IMK6_9FLOR|nr:Phosphatidylinositol 4-kinase [Gracilariopsis chorda]|eukprot:PXF43302.1 Phosphatidylinositol 4-kinase [Gracilariopsis chorda]